MHPVIMQAIAAEQNRERRAHAAAARRAREISRPRRPWPVVRIPRAGRGPKPAPQPARDPAAV